MIVLKKDSTEELLPLNIFERIPEFSYPEQLEKLHTSLKISSINHSLSKRPTYGSAIAQCTTASGSKQDIKREEEESEEKNMILKKIYQNEKELRQIAKGAQRKVNSHFQVRIDQMYPKK